MVFTNLTLVGGTKGTLVAPVLRRLLAVDSPAFNITVLVRPSSSSLTDSSVDKRIKLIAVDFDNHHDLIQALRGSDAVLSFLPSAVAQVTDGKILAAAEEAGVRRMFPAEYTLDILHPESVRIFSDGWENPPAIAIARRFMAMADPSYTGPTSFTTIMTSMFADFFLQGHMGIFDGYNKTAMVVDGGVHAITTCSTDFIAAAVVAALQLPEEVTKNKRIPIAEACTSGQEIVDTMKDVWGNDPEFTVIDVSTATLIEQKRAAVAQENMVAAYGASVAAICFGGSGAGNLVEGFEHTAGGLLDYERKSIRQLVVEAKQAVMKAHEQE